MGKPERKRPLGIPRSRWEDVVSMYVEEIGWGSVWSGLNLLRMGNGCGLL
jgi:hypothetical protein